MLDQTTVENSPNKSTDSKKISFLIFAAYAVLTVVMTWPVVAKLGSELAGGRSDLWIHQWTFWWVKEALQNGLSPFFTTQLYFPLGVSLTSHNIAWLNIAFWLPLQALVGGVAAYNLIILTIFTLNSFFFYLFARELTNSVPASFIGGLVYGFWPYTMSHYDHPNMILIFWVPLTLLLLHRTYKREKLSAALLAGVSLALVGLSRWQLLVMSAPLLIGYVLYLFLTDRKENPLRMVGMYLITGVLALLLMAPLAAPLAADQLSRGSASEVDVVELEGVTDLLSYVIPPVVYNHFWQDQEFRLNFEYPYQNIAASFNYVPFIGYLTLVLALYGVIRRWSKSWFWALMAVGYFLMALGPTLTIDANQFAQYPMPYRILLDSLIDVLIRRPHRLNLFLSLPAAMLVSWAMVDLMQLMNQRFPKKRPWLALMIAAAIGLIILWENPIRPFPTTSTEIPEWYQQLAEDAEEFGILELPTYERGFDKLYMFYQTRHGKPISGGHISRMPVDADAFREGVPFLQPMLRQDSWLVQPEEWVDFNEVDITRQFRQLADANIRYVVIHKELLPAGILARWRDWATMEPSYEDDAVLVYRTLPEVGVEFDIEAPLVDGIGSYKAAYSPLEANHAGTVKVDLRWASEKAPTADYLVCFSLLDAQGTHVETDCREIADDFPTSLWEMNELVRGSYVLPISGEVAPGGYELGLFLSEDGHEGVGETAVLGDFTVYPYQPENETDGCWEDKICIEGYDLQLDQDTLRLIPYWQAPQGVESSYKVFMHLIDNHSGEVVAQSDSIPRAWTYPTDIWEAGEIVRDVMALPVEGLNTGEYSIRLGWYNVDGGKRLLACPTGNCDEESAESLILTNVEIMGE